MALIPQNTIPNVLSGQPGYPYGKSKNVTSPGSGDGTPMVADIVNDIWGFMQTILINGAIVPDGTPGGTQYMQALLAKFADKQDFLNLNQDFLNLNQALGNTNATDMGAYTGAILTANQVAKFNIQELSDAIESIAGGDINAAIAAAQLTADNNSSALGVANALNMGLFSSKILTDNQFVKALLVELDNWAYTNWNRGNTQTINTVYCKHQGSQVYSFDANLGTPLQGNLNDGVPWTISRSTAASSGRQTITHGLAHGRYGVFIQTVNRHEIFIRNGVLGNLDFEVKMTMQTNTDVNADFILTLIHDTNV